MKDAITGTIKFFHPNGYGFVSTKDGDVFIHVEGFVKPEVVEMQEPVVAYLKGEPKGIKKGMTVVMEVEEGPKGKAAKRWCFLSAKLEAEKKVKEMPLFQLMSREIIPGKPYGDSARRCWAYDQHLVTDWVWQGYAYQLEANCEVQMNTLYLISWSHEISKDYATDFAGIKDLALDWYWTDWKGEKCRVDVNVDIDNKTVMIHDPANNESIEYDIITFVRES